MRTAILSTILIAFSFGALTAVLEAQLAGSWYPDDPKILKQQVQGYLDKAEVTVVDGQIIALISPHAGMIYSGETAAYGFKAAQKQKVDTVVVVGFSHRLDYNGAAAFDKEGFSTPLGVLHTDKPLLDKLVRSGERIFPDSGPFEGENSIELILPFIQVAFGNPQVLLVALGKQSYDNCSQLGGALAEVLKDQSNFLIIASTDLSHYLSQAEAESMDNSTLKFLTDFEPKKFFSQCAGQNRACGHGAVTAVMIAAKKLGADRAEILNRATSAKASGDGARVVGYVSAVFVKGGALKPKENNVMKQLLNAEQRKKLLTLARQTITTYVKSGQKVAVDVDDPVLNQTMGVFVTLHKQGELRGCIGNIVGQEPLAVGVRNMAIACATEDPRFTPISEDELDDISIEISVLSPLKRVSSPDEIILGEHGVLVRSGFQSGVYLPQVATETGWSKEQFLNSLCMHKAGLPADAWKKGSCEIYIFSAEVFGE